MRIYLAGSYAHRVALASYAKMLEKDGHIITSLWLTGMHEQPPWTETTYAQHDLQCIRDADVLLAFTEKDSSQHPRGGRHFEAGYAFAHQKRIVVVGPRENAFYHLYNVEQYDTFDSARANL